jgi:hypothetical protein
MLWLRTGGVVTLLLLCGAPLELRGQGTGAGAGASALGADPPKRPLMVAPPEPILKRYAVEAKAQGKTEIEKPVRYAHNSVIVFFSDWIRRATIVVATPTRLAAAQTVLPHTIVSWHIFTVARTLKTSAIADPPSCPDQPPADLHVSSGEFAVPLEGGTAEIDGVTVRLVRRDPSTEFVPGSKYLLIGLPCGNRNLLVGGAIDVYRVLENGDLAGYDSPEHRAVRIRSLGSIDALQQYIDTLPKP